MGMMADEKIFWHDTVPKQSFLFFKSRINVEILLLKYLNIIYTISLHCVGFDFLFPFSDFPFNVNRCNCKLWS